MKRLILCTLTLFLLVMALTGGLVTYARTQIADSPLTTYGFQTCDGKPCFMGVVAGKTTWQEVERLTQDNVVARDSGKHIIAKFNAISVEFFGDENNTQVVKYSVYLPHSILSQLGDTITLYGTPCGTDPLYGITSLQGVFIRFPFLNVGVVAKDSLNPFQHVSTVNFLSSTDCPDQDHLKWSGFAMSNRYEDQWQAEKSP